MRNKWILLIVLSLLTVLSLLINIHIYPPYLEEPRRAIIAMEMMFNDNYVVPTQFGEFYYKKPPVFNWLIILGYKLSGSYSEAIPRLISILSLLLTGLLNYFFVKQYKSREIAFYSSILYVISADIFFYFSLLGEIDLLYSLVSYASIVSIFYYYKKENYWLLYIVPFALAGIGTLIKGVPSPIFVAATFLALMWTEKSLKPLLNWRIFIGGFLFLIIVGTYFYIYHQYNDLQNYFEALWDQSSQRTVLAKKDVSIVRHMISFTLLTLKDILPISVFLPVMLYSGFRKQWRENTFTRFIIIAFFLNFLPYLISPGARSRYVYMLYPLIINYFTEAYFYLKTEGFYKRLKPLEKILRYLLVIIPLVFVVVYFQEDFQFIENFFAINTLLVLIGISLATLALLSKADALDVAITTVVVARLAFSLYILPVRSVKGEAANEKLMAYTILNEVHNDPLHLYRFPKENGISFTLGYFVEREREQVLDIQQEVDSMSFYLVMEQDMPSITKSYAEHFRYNYKGYDIVLIKMIED